MKKHFAIIGAGFSGLAVAWHLLNSPHRESLRVTLFDEKGIGGGASGIAAGLLHPFSGARSTLNRFGFEGMKATEELLSAVSEKEPLFVRSGILRKATSEIQRENFIKVANEFPFLELSSDELLISSGITVYPATYLAALWKAIQALGADFEKIEISSLESLKAFDACILCVGGGYERFEELSPMLLRRTKGQTLDYQWNQELPPLLRPLIAKKYLVMDETQSICIVGSTFERNFSQEEADFETAKKEIAPFAEELFPALKQMPILGCRAGFRVSGPAHLPVAKHLGGKVWTLTGMGSKGLLYHALFGKQLATELLAVFF